VGSQPAIFIGNRYRLPIVEAFLLFMCCSRLSFYIYLLLSRVRRVEVSDKK
jgi:hypothetical protein